MFVREDVAPVPHAALGLTGEAGEVADLIKKSQYENGHLSVMRLADELGDVLWYLTFIAGSYGFSVEEIAELNYRKLSGRHPHLYPDKVL